MPADKFLSTEWRVVVNSKDLSRYCNGISAGREKDRVEVSGFSGTKTREFLAGLEDQTLTLTMFQSFHTDGPHYTLEPLYESGSAFTFYIQPAQSEGTSATNPMFGGTAVATQAPLDAQLNDPATVEWQLSPAPNSRFAWGTA